MFKYISVVLIISTLFVVGCTPDNEGDLTDEQLASIAQCLTDKGAKMYGAVWCSHCKKQKDAFGEAFQYINYVECDPQTDLEGAKECLDKNIEGVPAWHFPDGTKKTGEASPQELAEIAGCSIDV